MFGQRRQVVGDQPPRAGRVFEKRSNQQLAQTTALVVAQLVGDGHLERRLSFVGFHRFRGAPHPNFRLQIQFRHVTVPQFPLEVRGDAARSQPDPAQRDLSRQDVGYRALPPVALVCHEDPPASSDALRYAELPLPDQQSRRLAHQQVELKLVAHQSQLFSYQRRRLRPLVERTVGSAHLGAFILEEKIHQ